jgi:hypothetical protein
VELRTMQAGYIGRAFAAEETYMLLKSQPVPSEPAPRQTAVDFIRDYRARLAVEEEVRAQRRRLEQAEQCLSSNPPATRIRAWEKVHGLRLPLNATHPILQTIAIATHLTLAEVRHEQLTRMAARLHDAPARDAST